MEELENSKENILQRRISMLVTIILVLAVMLCLYVVIQVLSNGYVNIGGFMMFRVVTGSMEPAIPVGSLLLTQQTDINTIQLQEVICFRTQESAIWGEIVTHRVVGIIENTDGSVFLATKGDANLVTDTYMVNADNFVGKVVWNTKDGSVLADIFSFFTNKIGFLGCIVFPCLLLTSLLLRDCVGNIRNELRKATVEMMRLEDDTAEEIPWQLDPLCGMTQEEYNAMYERIRAELIEELRRYGYILKEE